MPASGPPAIQVRFIQAGKPRACSFSAASVGLVPVVAQAAVDQQVGHADAVAGLDDGGVARAAAAERGETQRHYFNWS